MIECQICHQQFEKTVQFTTHLQFHHKDYNVKRYYNEFLKKSDDEGFCKICKKPIEFCNLNGYKTYCSKKCAWQDPEVKAKRAAVISQKSKEECRAWRLKQVQSKREKYGSALSTKDAESRLQRSIDHFTEYLSKCNCTLISCESVNNKIAKVTLKCNDCGTTQTYVRSLLDRYARTNDYTICHSCFTKYTSKAETEILEYLKSISSEQILVRNKQLIGKEVDLYLPNLKLAIEYDGLYWHNDCVIADDTHLKKTNACERSWCTVDSYF